MRYVSACSSFFLSFSSRYLCVLFCSPFSLSAVEQSVLGAFLAVLRDALFPLLVFGSSLPASFLGRTFRCPLLFLAHLSLRSALVMSAQLALMRRMHNQSPFIDAASCDADRVVTHARHGCGLFLARRLPSALFPFLFCLVGGTLRVHGSSHRLAASKYARVYPCALLLGAPGSTAVKLCSALVCKRTLA